MTLMKKWAKSLLVNLGYEIRKTGTPSPSAQGAFFHFDAFESQFELIKNLGKNNITILDVGAHKGSTAKKYRSMFQDAEIYCFEPFPGSIAELQRRFRDDPKVHIVPKAVGQEEGIATFYVNEFDATNSLLPRPTFGRRYYPKFAGPKEKIEVEVIDLDNFSLANNISKIDILKFDIQGGELNALHGAKKLLAGKNPSLIFTEIMFISHYEDSPLFHEVWSFLTNYGFSLFNIYNLTRARNGQIRQGDALFVNEYIRNNVINNYPEEP